MHAILGSRAERLANHLRDDIRRGQLTEPLPGTRLWSRQLGVSRPTLLAAIRELEADGWLEVGSRRVRLGPQLPPASPRGGRMVRLLFQRKWRPQFEANLAFVSALGVRLRLEGIDLAWEHCDGARMREYARRQPRPDELLVLASVPARHQRLFARSRDVLISGESEPGLRLPFVGYDVAGAVRHAAFHLLRRDVRALVFVHPDISTVGIDRAAEAFRHACASWAKHPVSALVIPAALDQASLVAAARRVAQGIIRGERLGIVVMSPIPVGVMVTMLLQYGWRIPRDAVVVALYHPNAGVQLYPPPIHYPRPVGPQLASLTEAAVRYFRTGQVPAMRRLIPAETANVPE